MSVKVVDQREKNNELLRLPPCSLMTTLAFKLWRAEKKFFNITFFAVLATLFYIFCFEWSVLIRVQGLHP